MERLAPLLIIFIAEAIGIFAEVLAARTFGVSGSSFWGTFFRLAPYMIIGGLLLLAGYMLGLATYKNIWIVSAISISSIVLVEPIVDLVVFGQLPTRGAVVGLTLGIGGVAASLFL